MLGFNAIVADQQTKRPSCWRRRSSRRSWALRTGHPIQLPAHEEGLCRTSCQWKRVDAASVLSVSAIGSPDTARRQVEEFVDRTKPDELMVTAQVFDHQARLRSYELLMEAVRQTA